jgi:hypothetical protein
MNAIAIANEVETSVSFAQMLMFECPILTLTKPRDGLCRPSIPMSDAKAKGRCLEATFEPEISFSPEIHNAAEWLICNAA